MKTLKHRRKKTSQKHWLSGKAPSVLTVSLIVFLMGMIWACQVDPGSKQRRGGTTGTDDFPSDWPVLISYDPDHVDRIALPLGGIGTGTVSLGGRGNLRDWEIMNRPAKGYNPGPRFEIAPFFALFTQQKDHSDTRILEGPVPLYEYEGARGVERITNHGMPRFEESTFDAAYPFGQVNLTSPGIAG